MDDYVSSHTIIKALKGSSEPPKLGGPSKIEIAHHAWASTDLYFPNKDEVLAEWILSVFLKDKGNASGRSALLSDSYWSLLGEVLATSPHTQSSRTNRVWLSPLLNRLSVATIATSFFNSVSLSGTGCSEKLAEDFVRCMLVLWPLAATRMNLDALSECFGSVLAYMSSDLAFPNRLASVCVLVSRSFRQSIGNSSNKKKTFSTFTQYNFTRWVRFICAEHATEVPEQRDEKSLKSEVLQTGIELRVLPQLYKAYIQETRKHRFAIFGSGSSHQGYGMSAFTSCYKTLRGYGDELEVWQSVLSLLEVLEEANLVGFGLSESTNVLNDIGSWAVNALSTSTGKHHFEIISPLTGEILSDIITVRFEHKYMMNPSDLPASQSLLHELLDFHSKTRTIPVYLAVGDFSEVQKAHRACTSGPLLSLAHLEGLSRAIKGFLTPGQTPETVQAALEALEAVWITYADSSGSDDTMDVDEDASDRASNTKSANGRKQKRRKTDEPAIPMPPKERAALSYSLVARAVAVILPSLPFSTLPESSYATVCSSISEAWEKFLGNTAQSAFSEKTNAPCWTDQIVTAATLRIRHALATCSSLRSLNTLDARIIPCGKTAGLIRFAETTPELIVELLRSFFDENLRVTDSEEQDAIIEAMLNYLYTNFGVADASSKGFKQIERDAAHMKWNASSSSLDFSEPGGHGRGALTVWHLVLDRWLPIIDDTCSESITFGWVVGRAMCSAEFWELTNLRDAMTSILEETSEHAHWDDFSMLMKQVQFKPKKVAITWDIHQVQSTASVFELLLRSPREYLPRIFEVHILPTSSGIRTGCGLETIIRAWLSSVSDTFSILDVVAESDDYIEYLMNSKFESENADDWYKNVTLELLANAHRYLICYILVSKIVPVSQRGDFGLPERSLLQFIEILTFEIPNSEKLKPTSMEAIKALYTSLDAKYSAALVILSDVALEVSKLHFVASGEREAHFGLIISSYIILLGRLGLAERDACDLALGRMARILTIKDFTFVLSFLREALAKGISANSELQCVVHLSSVLVGDAPEGYSEHFEECLQIFSADAVFVSGDANLSLEFLDFVGNVCSDKSASIRLFSVGLIWTLLAKLLTGSSSHSSHTHSPILHSIVNISSALVRLRRDLVQATLPHLGFVLRGLLLALRTPRPQLGARQRALVAGSLPWWVNPEQALGATDARAIARLLTALQTKTIPRNFGSREKEKEKDGGHRAEALAGAFSKHAGPVLAAHSGRSGRCACHTLPFSGLRALFRSRETCGLLLFREHTDELEEVVDGGGRRLNVYDKARAKEPDRLGSVAGARDELGEFDADWRGVEEDLCKGCSQTLFQGDKYSRKTCHARLRPARNIAPDLFKALLELARKRMHTSEQRPVIRDSIRRAPANTPVWRIPAAEQLPEAFGLFDEGGVADEARADWCPKALAEAEAHAVERRAELPRGACRSRPATCQRRAPSRCILMPSVRANAAISRMSACGMMVPLSVFSSAIISVGA
ncbi:hypothetical protein DFH11DRAFT_1685876 [Phellopilus nigrolimitatus]|nr:hypothetical protein DFH11DRAFT_1685876 [Phellopilus nigrolimitatus]